MAVTIERIYKLVPRIIKRYLCRLVIPSYTTAQRTAIVNPCPGRIVFDTDLNKITFYNGTAWEVITSTVI